MRQNRSGRERRSVGGAKKTNKNLRVILAVVGEGGGGEGGTLTERSTEKTRNCA